MKHTTDSQRVVLLDVLRVSLALLIFMFHSNMHFDCQYGLLNDFVSAGALAMTGFFLLSGYSLRLVYGEKNLMEKKELGRFYLKRILGILPLYYAFALLYIIILGKETFAQNMLLLPIEALGIQSTFSSLFGCSHNGGSWFISCLLLGYLVYPFLQTVIKQLTNKQKVLLIVLLISIDLYAVVISNTFSTYWLYDNPFYRIIEFTIGLLVADINTTNYKLISFLRSYWVLAIICIVFLASVSVVNHFYHIKDFMIYNWIALPCFVIMLCSMGSTRVAWLEQSRLLSYASKISYAFFLFQPFVWKVGRWLVKHTGYDNNWLRISFAFSSCVVVSVLMYEIVQKRIVGYIRKRYNI